MSQDEPLSPRTRAAGSARKAVISRKPSALKHGAFSSIDLMPWESGDEFDRLRRGLIEKYCPDGPLQEECMASIAFLMWRKRRIQKRRELDLAAELDRAENAILWQHPPPLADDWLEHMKQEAARLNEANTRSRRVREDYDELFNFSTSLYRDLPASTLRCAIEMLPAEFAEHLKKACPEGNYETNSQWIVALKREVDGVLLPMVRTRHPTTEGNRSAEAAAKVLNEKRLFADLAAEERIERLIDQQVHRFFKLQAADELMMHKRKSPVRMIEASINSANEPKAQG